MAKGAAKEAQLGALHARITDVFIKVMQRYADRLDALDTIDMDSISDEVLAALMDDAALPNPAMLSAVTKFLKDNEINFDSEQIEQLSDQERRLKERRELRGNVVSLTTIPVAGHG